MSQNTQDNIQGVTKTLADSANIFGCFMCFLLKHWEMFCTIQCTLQHVTWTPISHSVLHGSLMVRNDPDSIGVESGSFIALIRSALNSYTYLCACKHVNEIKIHDVHFWSEGEAGVRRTCTCTHVDHWGDFPTNHETRRGICHMCHVPCIRPCHAHSSNT